MPMQEIEVKYQVDTGGQGQIIAALAARGVTWRAPVEQDDQAYAEPGWDYDQPKAGRRFARLRTQHGRHLLTLKVVQDNAMACIEHETGVADRDQMDAILRAVGYRPTVRIWKRRRAGRWGEIELCLDDVEGLGVFLEAEVMIADEADGIEAQAMLDKQVTGLGVALERVSDTYDSLLRAAARPL